MGKLASIMGTLLGINFLNILYERTFSGVGIMENSLIRDRNRWGKKRGVGHSEGIIKPGFYGKTMYRNYIRSKQPNWSAKI
jgi:hypothetical protein